MPVPLPPPGACMWGDGKPKKEESRGALYIASARIGVGASDRKEGEPLEVREGGILTIVKVSFHICPKPL